MLTSYDEEMGNNDVDTFTSNETYNRMHFVDDFSSLLYSYNQLERSFREYESSSLENIQSIQSECIQHMNQYQYNTFIQLSSLSNDYELQLNEISQRLQLVQAHIETLKTKQIPSLNEQLEIQKKYKQFNEEYNMIAENILKKPSTRELLVQKEDSNRILSKLTLEGDDKKQKIEFYEKQMELLFKATNDLLDTFKV